MNRTVRRMGQTPRVPLVISILAITAVAILTAGHANADAGSHALPASGLNWYSLRWPLVGISIATFPIAGILIGLSATLRDRATLERVFGNRPVGRVPIGAAKRDITKAVRLVRRKAMRHSLVLLVLATLIGAAVAYLRTILKAGAMVDLLILPAVLALATLGYLLGVRRQSDGLPFEREPLVPALVGTVGALIVVGAASYATSAGIAIAVLSTFFYVSAFDAVPVIPLILMLGIAYIFFRWIPKILRFTAVPLDLGRRMVAGSVQENLAGDHRREVLFLRSFADDDLAVRTHRSWRHSPVELATALPFERFEVVLAWALWRLGPVCAIGKPNTGRDLQPLGAAREYYGDDTWQAAARSRIASAVLVVFVLGRTAGLQWEIRNARAQGPLRKSLFIVPPVAPPEAAERLARLADVLGIDRSLLPSVVEEGRHVIGVYFSDDFEPTLVCCDGRDDLAYQTMIELVGTDLADGLGEIVERPNNVSGPSNSHTTARVGSLLSQVYWDYESLLPRPTDQLTLRDGLRFVAASMFRRSASSKGSSAA